MPDDAVPRRALVVGMGSTGEAVARFLRERGCEVVAADDRPTPQMEQRATEIGVSFLGTPSASELTELAWSVELVVASPGVPVRHPVFAAGAPVVSELELAASRVRAPIAAVTGTNGKTTVTTLVAGMLAESGVNAIAAGNIGRPLIAVAEEDVDVFVVEASSFQLALTEKFRPRVAAWLNLAEDHLDWHPTMAHYQAAKARIWANQSGSDVAIGCATDLAVADALARVQARRVTFGLRAGDYREMGGVLVTPTGDAIVRVGDLPRRIPHDRANVLAATATALEVGATLDGCRAGAVRFEGLPHRVELVGEAEGVRYYDDSKATTPASVVSALAGFDSVVLIAGGRNKGLSLDAMREGAGRVKTVVSIGEAAAEVERAFSGVCPVAHASSMSEAVSLASHVAKDGDAVLLSPGCASFDWYRSYSERGDDFARCVAEEIARRGSAA
jgi:UDP-N-acetylmuramoylalanine--D-glutamate ligase